MPVWTYIILAAIFAGTCLLLTLIYMPRTEEIVKLRKTIKVLRKTIERMSKEATAAAYEHKADVGELSEKLLKAEGKQDQIASEYNEKLSEEKARTKQSEELREQLARAADKLREGASA